MKIVHFIYDHKDNPWVGGGGAVRVYELNRRLSERGHQIKIVSGKYPHARDFKEGNIEFHFIGTDKNYVLSTFSYAYSAHKLIRDIVGKFDVVVEDFAPWNPIFSYKYGDLTPVVLQIQNYIGKEILKKYAILGTPFYFIERYYPHKFQRVILVNEVLKARYNLPQPIFIGNGIDGSLIQERITFHGTYVGYIGRIDFYQKGLDVLLSQESRLNVRICGTGKQKNVLRLTESVNKNNFLEYLGYVSGPDKINFIKGAKFFVLPSRFEAQPLTILEVAALGKPLIVSDIPEMRFVTENGFGVSFKSEDRKDLEAKLRSLWVNDEAIEEMGKKGREFAGRHTWDKMAEEYERYLTNITKDG